MNRLRDMPLAAASLLIIMMTGSACEQQSKPDMRWSTRSDSVVESNPGLSTPALPPFEVVDAQLNASATSLLLEASESSDPLLRANSIEALHPVGDQLDEAVRRGLADDNEGVRYVAIMTVGLQNLCSVAHLVHPLLDDPSPSVRAASIYALARCEQAVDLNPLAAMVLSGDPAAKGNAAYVLGELGNASAIPLIKNGVGRHEGTFEVARAQTIDLVMAEAMVKLGDVDERQVIQAALFAPPERSELTAMACQMIGRMGDTTLALNLEALAKATGPRQPGIEIRLLASDALARIDPSRVPIELVLESISNERPEIRSQAATVLGSLGSGRYGGQLSVLLRDQDPRVQVAAAAAILRLGDASATKQ